MISRLTPTRLFVLGALFGAVWVGLWPVVDAITAAPEKVVPPVVAQEPSSCCEDVVPTEGCACCDLGCVSTGSAECSSSTAAPSCKCASQGGQVFLAALLGAADLPMLQIGMVDLADQAGLSRMIQPPVPPPLPGLLLNG